MTARSGTKEDRVFFLDDLRTIIIVLVVVYHAGGVYESTGAWASFWIVDDPATNAFSGLLGLVLDIFLMATMFFISGYFTPASLNDRTAWMFIKGKFRRLALPWIIAVLTLVCPVPERSGQFSRVHGVLPRRFERVSCHGFDSRGGVDRGCRGEGSSAASGRGG